MHEGNVIRQRALSLPCTNARFHRSDDSLVLSITVNALLQSHFEALDG
jgi:hypothetical protein